MPSGPRRAGRGRLPRSEDRPSPTRPAVQDPLAELVKVDPRSVGVGLYQHDVDQKALTAALDQVVVSAVTFAGVDLNTASASLLSHVAGLTRKAASAIVHYRE